MSGYNYLYASHQHVSASTVQSLATQAGIATIVPPVENTPPPVYSGRHHKKDKIIADQEVEEEDYTSVNKVFSSNSIVHQLPFAYKPETFAGHIATPLPEVGRFCYPQSFRCILLGILRI